MVDSLRESCTPSQDKKDGGTKAPFEAGLLRAFDKLTSEIFVFLLAYVILLIGLGIFASALSVGLRTLLYILPIVGIAAYAWLESGRITMTAKNEGVDVWSGVATRSGRVVGIRGAISSMLGRVKLRSLIVSGNARVVGVDVGGDALGKGAQEGYLLDMFRKLEQADRRKVVNNVSSLLEKRP